MEQKTVELKTVTCELCKTVMCPKCNALYNYLKWTLCQECYAKYNKKHLDRKLKTKEKRKIRKEKEKFNGEFIISFENGLLFKDLLESLDDLGFGNIFFRIKQESLEIEGMDSGRISTISIRFNLKNLIEYHHNQKQTVILNMSNILKIIPTLSNQSQLSLIRKKGNLNLWIQVGKHRFMEVYEKFDIEDIPFHNLLRIAYSNSFTINAEELCSILENARIVSDIINLRLESNKIIFYTDCVENHSYEYEYDVSQPIKLPEVFEAQGYYKICFTLHFLQNLIKKTVAWIKKDVKISVKFDNPLRMDLELEGGHEITFFQAPRVEGDPDDFDDEEDDDDDD